MDDDAEHIGGLTIFGKAFGNYAQDIKVQINYVPMEDKEIESQLLRLNPELAVEDKVE